MLFSYNLNGHKIIPLKIKKMVKKKTKTKKRKQTSTNNKNVSYKLLSYEISEEPIIDEVYHSLPQAIQDELVGIYTKLHRPKDKDTDRMLSRLEELIEQYPHVPRISNFLAVAYNLAGSNKFDACVEGNYN